MPETGRHEADESKWRLWRSILKATDKGAGAARRLREAAEADGWLDAKCLGDDGRWVEVRVHGERGKLMIYGVRGAGAVTTCVVATAAFGDHIVPRVFGDRGLRIRLTREMRIHSSSGPDMTLAMARKDVRAVRRVLER